MRGGPVRPAVAASRARAAAAVAPVCSPRHRQGSPPTCDVFPYATVLGCRPLKEGSAAAAERRGFFLAQKTRLSLKQEVTMREEIQRAEYDEGEEGFSDAP